MSAEAEWTPVCPPMRVCVDAAQAERYAKEIGADPSSAPLSFPAVWLTQPALHAKVSEICAAADAVPVHEAQRFHYAAPLTLGASYDLAVAMRQEEKPPRLVLQATLTTPDGAYVGRCETTLRIVPRAGLPKKDAA